jgi:hypothetical protein
MQGLTLAISILLPVYLYVLIGTNAVMITTPLLIVTALISLLCLSLIIGVVLLNKAVK